MDTLTYPVDHVLSEQLLECNGTRVLQLSPKEPCSVQACLPQLRAAMDRARLTYGGVLLRGFEALAKEARCSTAQLALAWVLAQGEHIVPIPGTRRIARLEENLGALRVRLSAAELAAIDTEFPLHAAAGTRYSEQMMGFLDR